MLRRTALIATIAAGAPALAADFVVSTSTTTQNGGHVVDGDDTITVQTGVTVDTSGAAGTSALLTSGLRDEAYNLGTLVNGANAAGIIMGGSISTASNSGTITATGANGEGVRMNGTSFTVRNSGTITTGGAAGHGVHATLATGNVFNTGTIRVTGAGANALVFERAEVGVFNSGLLVSKQGNAVEFQDSSNTLILAAPGFVVGGMSLGAVTGVIVQGGQSQSNFYTFTGVAWSAAGVTGDLPSIVNAGTQQIGTIDPTQFTARFGGQSQLEDAIAGALPGGAPGVQVTKLSPVPDRPAVQAPPRRLVWAQVFGAASVRKGAGALLPHSLGTWGVMAGIGPGGSASRFGFAGGMAFSHYAANATFANSQRIATTTLFGGPYARFMLGRTAARLSLTGGVTDSRSRRFINNNLVAGGLERADGSYRGWFLSPAARFSRSYRLSDRSWIGADAAASYTLAHTAGYTETGATGAAAFNAQTSRTARASFGVSVNRNIGGTLVSGLAGARIQRVSGADVGGTMGGQTFSYDPAFTLNGTTRYLGVTLRRDFGPSAIAQASATADYGSNGFAGWRADASLKVEF